MGRQKKVFSLDGCPTDCVNASIEKRSACLWTTRTSICSKPVVRRRWWRAFKCMCASQGLLTSDGWLLNGKNSYRVNRTSDGVAVKWKTNYRVIRTSDVVAVKWKTSYRVNRTLKCFIIISVGLNQSMWIINIVCDYTNFRKKPWHHQKYTGCDDTLAPRSTAQDKSLKI